MADEQSPITEGDDNHTSVGSGENQTDHSVLRQEITQKIQQLLSQDKMAAISEVVNLYRESFKQQKEVDQLYKMLEQDLGEKEIMLKTHMSQQQCLAVVQRIEQKRNFLACKLQSEYNQLSDLILFFDKIRVELKTDIGSSREAMEALNKRLIGMKRKATQQTMEYEKLVERRNTSKSEQTRKNKQLQAENDALRASQNEAACERESMMTEREAEVMRLKGTLTSMREDLLKSLCEKDELIKQFDQFKQSSEKTIAALQQEMDAAAKEMKQQHDEQLLACDSKESELQKKTQTLEDESRKLKEQIQDLANANERFRQLQEKQKQKGEQKTTRSVAMGAAKRNDPSQTVGHTTVKMPSFVRSDTSFDINLVESYHHESEMSEF